MKKIILSGVLALLGLGLFAQDIKKVNTYLKAQQLDKAKTEIDAFVTRNPSNAEGYYTKAKVYGAIAANKQFSQLDPQARATAFEAFKKAIETDTENKLLVLLIQDQYSPIFNLYVNGSETAAQLFNDAASANNKAGFNDAMNMYLQTNEIGRYINSKKYATLGEIDTPVVLNIMRSALYADNKPTTLMYAKILADAGIHSYRSDVAGYDLAYKYLASNYAQAKDESNLMKYETEGKKYFPNDPFFDDLLIEYYADVKNYKSLFTAYDQAITKHPDSTKYHLQYASDLLQAIYNEGTSNTDKVAYRPKFESEIGLVMKADPGNIDANQLSGHYYYNTGADLQNEAKSIADAPKKAEKNRLAKESVKKSIPYFEKVIAYYETGNKKADRSKYKTMLNTMQDLYNYFGDKAQENKYQQKYDAADSRFVK
ncbi:hypothetical protein BH09BAC2_BH09BAC2_20500 [soil metagenome]